MRKLMIMGVLINVLAVAMFAQSTEFTYQGRLLDSSVPASANYDFQFSLWDSLSNGTQQGTTQTVTGVAVTNGVFTVRLNFGAQFTGAARFLQIEVRPAGGLAYTMLAPRQPITSSPYSIKSAASTSSDGLSVACVLCVTDAHIQSIDGGKVTGTVASATTAANVSGIVAIANGGTGSSTKNFVDLSTNQTQILGNKTFAGQTTLTNAVVGSATFSAATFNNADPVVVNGELNVGGAVTAEQFGGSGEGLVNVPGTFKWQTVAGLEQQAERNTGYVATNDSQVTVTLPTSPIIGDTVRVSAAGSGGWKIAQNAGQSVIGANLGLLGANWTPREGVRAWGSVASSAAGMKLVAAVIDGRIYTSVDAGVSWVPRESNRSWQSLASSADGTKLVAGVGNGQIYTSTDSGITWTPRESSRFWISVASSADGTKLVAAAQGQQIYTSSDSGVTWTPRDSNRGWQSVASSADGTKLVAVVQNGRIYTSTDSGMSWTAQGLTRLWWWVASSADGSKLVAVVKNGDVHTSVDSGVTWAARGFNQPWHEVASSADGTKLVAVVDGGQIYTSSDSGGSWTARESVRFWYSVASSADGTRLVAVDVGGQIYTSTSVTTVGPAGYMTGGKFSAVELQYAGNGLFVPLSHSGGIQVF